MERPTDAFKETHNLVVAPEDTYVGGLVSNLQVAELIGCMAKNRKLAYCKIVEAMAETTAPLLPIEQLLSAIPSKREPPAEEEEEDRSADDAAAVESGEVAKTERPLSPYTAYEGLKPPSSPSPTASSGDALSSSKKQIPAVADVQGKAAASSTTSSHPLSPYTAFVDLKPPSSPSPSPPSSSATGTTGTATTGASSSELLDSHANGTPISGNTASPSDQPQGVKQQPLSPYTRYEELKPPSSPTPSAPKT